MRRLKRILKKYPMGITSILLGLAFSVYGGHRLINDGKISTVCWGMAITSLGVCNARKELKDYGLVRSVVEEHGFGRGFLEDDKFRRLSRIYAEESNRMNEFDNAMYKSRHGLN